MGGQPATAFVMRTSRCFDSGLFARWKPVGRRLDVASFGFLYLCANRDAQSTAGGSRPVCWGFSFIAHGWSGDDVHGAGAPLSRSVVRCCAFVLGHLSGGVGVPRIAKTDLRRPFCWQRRRRCVWHHCCLGREGRWLS